MLFVVEKSSTGRGFCPEFFGFSPCHNHSTNIPCSVTHLSLKLYNLNNRLHEIHHFKKRRLLICCFGFVGNCRFYVGCILQLLLSIKCVFRLQRHKYSYIPTRHKQCFFTLWTRHLTFLNGKVYTPSLGAVLLFVLPLEAGAGARVVFLSESHVG